MCMHQAEPGRRNVCCGWRVEACTDGQGEHLPSISALVSSWFSPPGSLGGHSVCLVRGETLPLGCPTCCAWCLAHASAVQPLKSPPAGELRSSGGRNTSVFKFDHLPFRALGPGIIRENCSPDFEILSCTEADTMGTFCVLVGV